MIHCVSRCIPSNSSHGQRAKSFHFRRKWSADRSKMSRGDFTRGEFEQGCLSLSLFLFPVYPRFESLLAGNRLLGILVVDRGRICRKSAHIYTRTHFHSRFFREIRSSLSFFFFFLTWRSSLLQQVSTTIDFLTTLDNVSKGANGEKEREYRSETERGKYRSFHLSVEIESKVIIVTSFF